MNPVNMNSARDGTVGSIPDNLATLGQYNAIGPAGTTEEIFARQAMEQRAIDGHRSITGEFGGKEEAKKKGAAPGGWFRSGPLRQNENLRNASGRRPNAPLGGC